MIPGFQELEHVARAGLDNHGHRVGDVGDLGLRLPDADSLDHHHIKRRGQRVRACSRRGGEATQPVASRGRADEHAAVGRVDLDPGAVAEQRAARAP